MTPEIGTQTRIVRVAVEDGSLTPMPEILSGGHMSWSGGAAQGGDAWVMD